MIRTILGDIQDNELGWCQCHEHLFIADGKSRHINASLYMDDYGKTLSELVSYKKCGGNAVVDAQPAGCGRMAGYLKKAAEESGGHIIASTGFHKQIFYDEDHWIFNISEDKLAAFFMDEITKGLRVLDMDGPVINGNCAGVIKTAVDGEGIYKNKTSERLFNAAAAAATETGVPILCHTEYGCNVFEIIKFFSNKGIKYDKIILCHLDRTQPDPVFHCEAAESGVFIEYDTINRPKYHDDKAEADLILNMIKSGHIDRLLLGLDTTNQRLKSYGGKMGLNYILDSFLRKLKLSGISGSDIQRIMEDNPLAALAVK
jgi:5-phospho-D-xylono-1,4-lactonase